MKSLNLKAIRIDGGTQARAKIDNDAVAEYTDALKAGAVFPPVVVFHDGTDHWLADGFHRFHAHRAAAKASIPADVRTGSQREAVLFSLGANSAHGLRRSNSDKRRSVETMLADAEWAAWSDRKIAETCGVSVTFVGALRRPQVAAKRDENRAASAERKASERSPATPMPPQGSLLHEVDVAAPTPVAATATGPEARAVSPQSLDDGEESVDELLDRMSDEIRRADARVQEWEAAMLADDSKAHAARLVRRLEQMERARDEAMDKAARLDRRVKALERDLAKCGNAVGEQDLDKIVAAVRAMAKQAKAVPA